MHPISYRENRNHGTPEFPAEYYYVDSSHPRYDMSFHWHKEWELIRILRGNFAIHIDEEEILAEEGDILLIGEGKLHGGTPNNCVYECFVFDLHGLFRSSELIKRHLRPFYRLNLLPYTRYSRAQNATIRGIVSAIMESCALRARSVDDEGCELAIVGGLCSLFSCILRNHLYTEDIRNSSSPSARVSRIKSVLEYIERSYQSPITLGELADVAGMNPNYFCRLFKEYTRQTPMDYVIFYRIEQAALMLSSTNTPIMEISMECGFNDCSYFTRTFKRLRGITPNQYRKLNSESRGNT